MDKFAQLRATTATKNPVSSSGRYVPNPITDASPEVRFGPVVGKPAATQEVPYTNVRTLEP